MVIVFLKLTPRFRMLFRRKWAAENFRRGLISPPTSLPLGSEIEGMGNGSSESELEMQATFFLSFRGDYHLGCIFPKGSQSA